MPRQMDDCKIIGETDIRSVHLNNCEIRKKRRERKMEEKIYDTKRYAETARAVAAEGIVMLRNEEGVLPACGRRWREAALC